MELTFLSPTHIAVQSGNWSDPETWDTGTLPIHGSRILIPNGVSVKYDLESDSRLKTVDIAGELHFDIDKNTLMLVDTITLLSSGTLTLGTEFAPIPSEYQARVIFAPVDPNERGIDKISDPLQLSRGLITQYGSTLNIEGAKKTPYLTLANGASRFSNTLEFDSLVPTDWRIGDKVVITATSELGKEDILEITEINGNSINFVREATGATELAHDYITPNIDIAKVYVANLTRNISFETEAGVNAPINERGHIMLMDNANINNAAFIGLGRTNKDIIINNPVIDADGQLVPSTGTNPGGRYSIHLHEIKAEHPEDTGISNISGNAVWGSPGWGIVVHSSHANVSDNVVYDVLGAHYVTETGDELVNFTNNLAIKGLGSATDKDADLINPIDPRGQLRDFGSSGIGFWLASSYSAKSFQNNIATGMANAGIIVYGINDAFAPPNVPTESLPPELQYIAGGTSTVASWKVPLRNFQNNTVYNSPIALELRGLSRDDTGADVNSRPVNHTEPSIIDNIHAWNIRKSGIDISYASHIKIKDSSIYGNLGRPIPRLADISNPKGVGIYANKNVRSIVYDNVRVEGFDIGIIIPQTSGQGYNDEIKAGASQLIGGYFANNTYDWYPAAGRVDNPPTSTPINPLIDRGPITPYFIVSDQPNFSSRVNVEGAPPIASFTVQQLGKSSILFDASSSYDPDYNLSWSDSQNGPYTAGNNTIAAFSWDFDGDGVIDDFGRYAIHKFEIPGQQSVTLSVMDLDGVTSTTTFDVLVDESSVSNRIANSDFSRDIFKNYGSTMWFRSGQNFNTLPNSPRGNWYAPNNSVWVFDPENKQVKTKKGGAPGLIQIIEDNGILTGFKTISFDAINQEENGTLRLEVFGVKGRFNISNWVNTAPRNINFSLPFEQNLIFDSGNIASQKFPWVNFRWDNINFGNGYEYVVLRFTSTGASIENLQAVDNIYVGDNDDLPVLNDLPVLKITTNPQVIVEGLSRPQSIVYTVSLTGLVNNGQVVTVQYATSNGSATSGSDYTRTTGTLIFIDGVTSQNITIPILNDALNEADETFNLTLSNPTQATLGDTAFVTTTITDTLVTDVTTTLMSGVENLTLIGVNAINGTGDSSDNIITGNSANNIFNGGAGIDTLIGGLGDDIYVVDTTTCVITENPEEGTDTVRSSVTFTLASLTNIENLTLTGSSAINGTGNTGNNTLTGNNANNILDGGAGMDTLNGAGGVDTLIGGAGDDLYVVDTTTDVITENVEEGTDTVQSSVTFTLADLANLENLILTGTSAINGTGNGLNNVIIGNTGNNTLNGEDGIDTLIGGLGSDTYVLDSNTDVITENAEEGTDTIQSSVTFDLSALPNIENLTLTGTNGINGTGNAANNTITGNTADNILTGGDGIDTLIGGAGNDIYVVDTTTDVITESAASGTDTVQSSVTFSIASLTNVENLTLRGSNAINGTGNTGRNTIIGNTVDNLLAGGGGADTLTGGLGVDRFSYRNLGDSLLGSNNNGFDVITDLDASNDLFMVTTARSEFIDVGEIASLDATGIGAALTSSVFKANSAAQFTITNGSTTRIFVAINNSTAGFSATADAIVEMTGLTGTISLANFTTI